MAESKSPIADLAGAETIEDSGEAVETSGNANVSRKASKTSPNSSQTPSVPKFPPPKTDKPRPHVCTTCTRSFARLEHLKRHERSHTKEKPFECPSCTRCFARRDLLLRHQQKLHSTTTPSSKPRNARRESTAGVATGRVRKNSVAGTANTSMRPRANTLSHIDTSTLGVLSNGGIARSLNALHGQHHHSFNGLSMSSGLGFRGLGLSNNAHTNGLPRIETHGLPLDLSSGLRTAPPHGNFGSEFDLGTFGFEQDGGNTINPHALHMHNGRAMTMDGSFDTAHHLFSGMSNPQTLVDEDGFEWMTHGFENQMSFAHANENAIDDSSPSAMSTTNSPSTFNEMTNINNNNTFVDNTTGGMMWPPAVSNAQQMVNSPMSMDMNPFFGDLSGAVSDTISPQSLLAHKHPSFELNFPTPPDLAPMDPVAMAAMSTGAFSLPFKQETVASTASTASADSSLRQSSVTTTSSELVSDHMRNVLVATLSQSTGFGQQKLSQPAFSSPLSPGVSMKPKGFNAAAFPTAQDLQRYVSAYIKYFHPHLPFLHVATLSFESAEFTTTSRMTNGVPRAAPSNPTGGGSCLLLSVTALGALFEGEATHSKELFEYAKRLISMYLEDRRTRLPMKKGSFLPQQRSDREDTPLWLVQAMLLNVIYGHNSGDKTAADIASNHCAALVSLARSAELAKPYMTYANAGGVHTDSVSHDSWSMLNLDSSSNDSDWYEWKTAEERKRTLYAVFILSSMLVTAYNRAPALTNSEIRLDLPCEEELWSVDSAQAWRALGGAQMAEARSFQFASALTHLLTAAQRQRRAATQHMTSDAWSEDELDLRPSSFGCLVLINALHNYIWETRQRHLGRQWTPHEIESMHAHIEPALRAWQTAWFSNPTHAIERPNPFGAGPLSADSIPLLDLAYVRLFVDFGRSKEAYWQRDYDAMAQELAKGSAYKLEAEKDVKTGVQTPASSPNAGSLLAAGGLSQDAIKEENMDMNDPTTAQSSQRERHLRKAAFYAADHLLASDRLGTGLDENTARELPMQSILCACDSAQVLAEWTTTVQERVGKYVGVLGRDRVDLSQMPGVLLLDDEDRKLLNMVEELLASAEAKGEMTALTIETRAGGYGSRILVLTSQTMARAAIWPVTRLMARSLETQAGHVKARVLASVQ